MNKEEATALANEGKKKATAFWTAFKEKIVALWKSGRKGKAICIGGAVVLLFLLMRACGGSDSAKPELGNSGKLSASNISDKKFTHVFIGNAQEDEGVIYVHIGNPSIRIIQATSDGLLVGYSLGASFERIVWITTKSKAHEENRPLGKGFFVRRGKHSFVGTDGGEHILAQYVEITDEKDIAMIMDELKRREEAKEAAEAKARELDEEHGAIELDIPVPSLCGFKLGVPPSQVKPLLVNDDGTPLKVLDIRYARDNSMRLATPFRMFTKARVNFSSFGKGKHLDMVELFADDFNSAKYTWESYETEIENTVRMIEKKFGIEFERRSDSSGRYYSWGHEKDRKGVEYINVQLWHRQLSLTIRCPLVSELEKQQHEASKKSIVFDANADQL